MTWAAIASLLAGASIGVGVAAWLWSRWVRDRHVLPAVAVVAANLAVLVIGLAFSSHVWAALATGSIVGSASALIRIGVRGPLRSLHLAALPVSSSTRWRIALGDVLHTPSGDPRDGRVDVGRRAVAPTGDRVVLPPPPCRFRGLGGWYLGLGLDAERSAWAAQLAGRVLDDLDLLADPLVLLSDAQVAVLAVCRTLAFDVETIVLQRPFGSMDGDIRRRLQELVEEESNRRHVVVE